VEIENKGRDKGRQLERARREEQREIRESGLREI